MHVHESGPETAEAIVFLHGVGASAAMWRAHLRHFAGYRCIVPDFPGFGDSAGEPWVSIAVTAEAVAGLIAERVGERAHVVGVSLGGIVGLKLLASRPELIDHAVIDGASVLPIRHLRLARTALRLIAPIAGTWVVTAVTARLVGIVDREQFRKDYGRMSKTAFRDAFIEALDFTEPPGLDRVPCPTLFVAGEREPASTLASIRHLAAIMPRAQAHVAPGLWHGWIAPAPDLHCRMVEAWIRDEPLPAELRRVG